MTERRGRSVVQRIPVQHRTPTTFRHSARGCVVPRLRLFVGRTPKIKGFSINTSAVFTGAFEMRAGSCTSPSEVLLFSEYQAWCRPGSAPVQSRAGRSMVAKPRRDRQYEQNN